MCNVHDPRILNAYIAITEDEATDWLILGYNDTRDTISLYSCGEHGLSEFRENIITNEILFGFIRIEEKFLLITFIPDSVNGVRRARALVHSRTVAGILELSHSQMTASGLSDLSDINIRTRLKLEPGRPKSRSSFTSQRRRKSGASYYSPSPSPIIFADDDDDTLSDRTTATPTPSTPTFNEPASPFFVMDTFTEEPKRLQDSTESILQQQLLKKKEMEESRFKLFQKEQPNIMKRIEEEQKRIKMQQKERVVPQWQVELQQRKLQKRQNELRKIQSFQQIPRDPPKTQVARPKSIHFDRPVPKQKEESLPPREPLPREKIQSPLPKVESIAPQQLEEKIEQHKLPESRQKVEPLQQEKLVQRAEPTPQTSEQPPVEQKVESTSQAKTIVKSGFVSVQVNQSPFWKRRYYTVTEDELLLYTDENCKSCLYNIQFKDTLRISLIDEDEEVYVPNSFMIETHQKELYQLLADDKKEYKSLYTTLKQFHTK